MRGLFEDLPEPASDEYPRREVARRVWAGRAKRALRATGLRGLDRATARVKVLAAVAMAFNRDQSSRTTDG